MPYVENLNDIETCQGKEAMEELPLEILKGIHISDKHILKHILALLKLGSIYGLTLVKVPIIFPI